jgi:tetrahydromethanopterin S-methyltransferase subunit A
VPGDTVEVEIDGIEVVANPIAATEVRFACRCASEPPGAVAGL